MRQLLGKYGFLPENLVTDCLRSYHAAAPRAAAARTIPDLREAISLALDAFTPSECQNYFTAAGYDAT